MDDANDVPREARGREFALRLGFGVSARSGTTDRRLSNNGVLTEALGLRDASESGGEGGVGTPEALDVSDLGGGGVEAVGDEVVVREISEVGDLGKTVSVVR